jgi:Bacterial flagellin N-terminal helical region
MSGDIVLSAGVRSNLLALQNTASLMAQTQERLSSGKKVNSALDNPINFFTASALTNRASDISGLLDGVGNAIQRLPTTASRPSNSWCRPLRPLPGRRFKPAHRPLDTPGPSRT